MGVYDDSMYLSGGDEMKRSIYIDGVIAKTLVNHKTMYTWFEMVDGSVKRVSSYEYERESVHGHDIVLISDSHAIVG